MKIRLMFQVNGEPVDVLVDDYKTLLEVLREDLGLTGTKHGCELGECGACAVIVDGEPILSCLALAAETDGRHVTTVEGLATGGQLHPLQECFADHGAAQCGYCTPGILMTAKSLLDREPKPSRDRIREALSGNLCRCTGYRQIIDAVEAAAVFVEQRGVGADGSRLETQAALRRREADDRRLETQAAPRRREADDRRLETQAALRRSEADDRRLETQAAPRRREAALRKEDAE